MARPCCQQIIALFARSEIDKYPPGRLVSVKVSYERRKK